MSQGLSKTADLSKTQGVGLPTPGGLGSAQPVTVPEVEVLGSACPWVRPASSDQALQLMLLSAEGLPGGWAGLGVRSWAQL